MRKILTLLLLLSLSAAGLEKQSNADYRARRMALAEKAKGSKVLIFADVEVGESLYGFRQNDDFYYLTGWTEPGAALIVQSTPKKDDAPASYTEILFLPAHNKRGELFTGPKLGAENPEARKITGFDRVESLDNLSNETRALMEEHPSAVYSNLPVAAEPNPSTTAMLGWLNRTNTVPVQIVKDVKEMMDTLRMVKDAGEMKLIQKAVDASIGAHLAAMHAMKTATNERGIASLMQYEYNKRGCERPAYAPIVGAGLNSTILHYDADDAPIQNGDVVVLDVAGEYSMYASDITRTLPANGKYTARQREIYEIVRGAQEAAAEAFVAGKSKMYGDGPESLNKVAMDYIKTHGKDLHGEPLGKYFIHGLGHHVGLNVHDPADYTAPLDKGNVFTIEPGIYIPEEKLGVRIEDMYWVDGNGKLVKLTAALPSTPDEVEKVMAGHE